MKVNNNQSKWKEEAWENQGFNGIQTCHLYIYMYQCNALDTQQNYEATHWEWGQFIEFIFSHKELNDAKYMK